MGRGSTDQPTDQRIPENEVRRDLDLFLSLANHDLQAPLRTLRSFVELAAEEHPSPFLDEAMAIAGRLQRLLRATLTYGRLPRHRMRLRAVPLPVAVELGMQRAGLDLSERPIDVKLASGMPAVLADRVLLAMGLEAILDNALRFAHPERQPVITIDAVAAGDRIRLRIDDNGLGVPAADRQRCFDPMVRLAGSGRAPGDGFGLAVVRRACDMMRGTCGMADTADGLGVRVWLELPAVPPGFEAEPTDI